MYEVYTYNGNTLIVNYQSNYFYDRVSRIFRSWNPLIKKEHVFEQFGKEKYRINILDTTIQCCLEDEEYEFNNVCATDIYVIIYLLIYCIFMFDNKFGVHSVAVCKENIGVLVPGDFGIGKTTLAIEFEKYGWSILAADHAVVQVNSETVEICGGSRLAYYEGNESIIEYVEDGKKSIKNIIIITGLSRNGETKIQKIQDKRNYLKKVWTNFVWPWNTIVQETSKPPELLRDCYYNRMVELISSLNKIEFWEVRGDPNCIAYTLNKILLENQKND